MKGAVLDYRDRAGNILYYLAVPFLKCGDCGTSVITFGRLAYPSNQENVVIVRRCGGSLARGVRPASIILRSATCCLRKLSGMDQAFSLFRSWMH